MSSRDATSLISLRAMVNKLTHRHVRKQVRLYRNRILQFLLAKTLGSLREICQKTTVRLMEMEEIQRTLFLSDQKAIAELQSQLHISKLIMCCKTHCDHRAPLKIYVCYFR